MFPLTKNGQLARFQVFSDRAKKAPHNAWMEDIFLNIVQKVQENKIESKIPADQIQSPNPNDPEFFSKQEDF